MLYSVLAGLMFALVLSPVAIPVVDGIPDLFAVAAAIPPQWTRREQEALDEIRLTIGEQLPDVPDEWHPHLLRCYRLFSESLGLPPLSLARSEPARKRASERDRERAAKS